MNFRSCKYFLTVCEMGTVSAAARKLYISQQSLSQHIRKMENEVGAPLFHRNNPLTLTEEGRCVKRAAETVIAAMERMDEEIAACRNAAPRELTVGLLDYGTPEFLPALIDIFIKKEPEVLFSTREVLAGEKLPRDVPLFISSHELGGEYKSEALLEDRLCVVISDTLLRRTYGDTWRKHREALRQGDLHALEGCPFLQHRNTPLQAHQEMAFANNNFTPRFLPVLGSPPAFTLLCVNGRAAMLNFAGAMRSYDCPCYPIANVPEAIPTVFICYRQSAALSSPARHFLEITRRYFAKLQSKSG